MRKYILFALKQPQNFYIKNIIFILNHFEKLLSDLQN